MPSAVLEELDEAERLRLIAPGGIGRLVFAGQFDVTVLPVNYKLHDGAILFKTTQHRGVRRHFMRIAPARITGRRIRHGSDT
jgi:nitroimidazol reductase NimA-like FMN-containing flavoprotein (pyridoxamine 5'-phosphate oxidase superfamily)